MVQPPFFGKSLETFQAAVHCKFNPPKGSDSLLESIPPHKIHLDKLVLGISPSILNCFLRSQRRYNLLIHTFPTVHNMIRFSEGISEEEQVNKKHGKFQFSSPRIG